MPNAYTEPLYRGEDISFEDFTLRCARAMGALILMRDRPLDAPIPDRLEPDIEYSESCIRESKKALRELEEASAESLRAMHEEYVMTTLNARAEIVSESIARKNRYINMLEKVKEWTPPSEDHIPLKNYMIRCLTESIEYDCVDDAYLPKVVDFDTWLDNSKNQHTRNLEYYQARKEEEIQLATERTKWILALKESLS